MLCLIFFGVVQACLKSQMVIVEYLLNMSFIRCCIELYTFLGSQASISPLAYGYSGQSINVNVVLVFKHCSDSNKGSMPVVMLPCQQQLHPRG